MIGKKLRKTQNKKRIKSKSNHSARKHVKKQTRGRKVKKGRKTRRNHRLSSTSLKNLLAAFS